MEKEIKELEKRVSRLEELTGKTYDIYLSDRFIRLPLDLVKFIIPNSNETLETIKLRDELSKERLKNKQLEELVTNLLLKLNKVEEVEII